MNESNPFSKYVGSKPMKITRELFEKTKPIVLQKAETVKLRVPLETEGVHGLWQLAGREVGGVGIHEVDGQIEISFDLKEKTMPGAPIMMGVDPGSGPSVSHQQIWQNSWSSSDPLVFVRVKVLDEFISESKWHYDRVQRCELLDSADLKSLPEQPEGSDLYLITDVNFEAGSEQSVPFYILHWLTSERDDTGCDDESD